MKQLFKDIGGGLINVLKRFLLTIICTLGVVTVFGLLLEKLETVINTNLYKSLGSGAVLFTAAIGTPLHEIAHWLVCKLFGFTIIDVELLRPVAYKTDGILGYVSYTYDRTSTWQTLGCVFSGMAPLLLGVVFIYLVVKLIRPETITEINNAVTDCNREKEKPGFITVYSAAFIGFWKGLFKKSKFGVLKGILCLYIICSISMHMTLSTADIRCAIPGLKVLFGLYLIHAVITAMIGREYVSRLAKTAAFIAAFLSIGLIADMVMLAVSIIL